MVDNTGNTPFEKLVANVIETRFENLDRDAVVHAKNRIIDVIGCLIGGANAPGNRELINMVRDWGGKEEATILIHGGKAPLQNAAFVNSILERSFDFEPVGPAVGDKTTGGHISGSTVMTAFTVGESTGVDGKGLLTALLVGDDLASRILISGSVNPASRNKWAVWPSTGTVNMFGTAAVAGRLLGLNHKQMKYALGIALDQTGGSFQMIWSGTTAFKMTQGISARNGILSAQLAKAGWTGPDDILFSEFGYYNMFAEGYCNQEILTKDLGKKYYSDGTIKPYPCCRINHSAIDCALALVTKYNIDARDIGEVILYVSPVAMRHICSKPFRIGEFPQANAAFSFQYTIATALLRKSVKPEHFTEEAIRGSEINAFIDRITIEEQHDASKEGVELKAVLKDGREITESTRIAKGDQLWNPLSKDEILTKFWNNVDFSNTVSRENAGKILALLENLEELDSVDKIVPLLVAPDA